MMMLLWVLCLLLVIDSARPLLSTSEPRATHVVKSQALLTGRTSPIHPLRRSPHEHLHSVIFAVQQQNVDLLHDELMKVSDPFSASYGKHWTAAAVGEFTRNGTAVQIVLDYLQAHQSNGVRIQKRSLFDEFIVAQAPIAVWENIFDTQFFAFAHEDWNMTVIHRSLAYSLPIELVDSLHCVFEVDTFPTQRFHRPIASRFVEAVTTSTRKGVHSLSSDNIYSGYVSPQRLTAFYNITLSSGSSLTSQAVYSTIDQTLSPRDLMLFQNRFSKSVQNISSSVGGHIDDNACVSSTDNCVEANLDFQYLMTTAQDVPTMSYYSDLDFASWLVEVASMDEVPHVITMSYGSIESTVATSQLSSFSTQAQKLGLQGISILAASGDDGVAGFTARTSALRCAYRPMFPASCPYVTAVGGTMGPESDSTEIACSTSSGGSITSGGGFSSYFARPSYQSTVVSSYLAAVTSSSSSSKPVSGYSSSGRGYPDVSLLAQSYLVTLNSSLYVVSGTSASSPTFAGFVSLVNNQRLAKGLSKLGFLNPTLYAYYSSFVNDITSGRNKCTSSSVCCTQGFTARTGWDPVTGLGSVDFQKFLTTVMGSLSTSSPSQSPTRTPSLTPTVKPTVKPTAVPTVSLSKLPSPSPTVRPSLFPTVCPSVIPSASPSQRPSCSSPTLSPTTILPSIAPSTVGHSTVPTWTPTAKPSTVVPSGGPVSMSSSAPTAWSPVAAPTGMPTSVDSSPTSSHEHLPFASPTVQPTLVTVLSPSKKPSKSPTLQPVAVVSSSPTRVPSPSLSTSLTPSVRPSTPKPSVKPTRMPTTRPVVTPTAAPSLAVVSNLLTSLALTVDLTCAANCPTTFEIVTSKTLQNVFANSTCSGLQLSSSQCVCDDTCLSLQTTGSSVTDIDRISLLSSSATLTANVSIVIGISSGDNSATVFQSLTSLLTSSSTSISTSIAGGVSSYDSTLAASVQTLSLTDYSLSSVATSPTASPTSAAPQKGTSTSGMNSIAEQFGVSVSSAITIVVVVAVVVAGITGYVCWRIMRWCCCNIGSNRNAVKTVAAFSDIPMASIVQCDIASAPPLDEFSGFERNIELVEAVPV